MAAGPIARSRLLCAARTTIVSSALWSTARLPP